MDKANVLDAIERINFAVDKLDDLEGVESELSQRVLGNRIITLEGYLRFLDIEGIPKLEKISEKWKGEYND